MFKKIINRILLVLRNIYVEHQFKKKNSEKEKFSLIYKFGYWRGFDQSSLSGAGSNNYSTQNLRKDLQKFIYNNNINSILDIPCGDFYWFKKIDLSKIQYTGADIVEAIVKDNIDNYKTKNINFINLDLVNNKLPEVDMIFVRDCFVHLKNDQIVKAINNVIESKSKFFATTTNIDLKINSYSQNVDRWRPLNMCIEPFSLPKPFILLDDTPLESKIDKDKKIGIWKISELNKFI